MVQTIKVTGNGMLSLKPDIIRLFMTVSGVREDYEETLNMSAERTGALRDCFESVGFEREALKTTRFCVDVKYENRRGSDGNYERVFVGYEFNSEMKIEFDADSTLLGRVLTALSGCEAVPEFRIEYSVRDREAAKGELLELAVADSRAKAERLAKASGMKGIMKAKCIDCSGCDDDMTVRPAERMMLAKCNADGINPDITPENVRVSCNVTVMWQFID